MCSLSFFGLSVAAMASKGQRKGDAKKKAKPTPFNSKNPLHIPELARLLKIAREKYQLKQSTELLNFVTCTGPVWGERNKTEPNLRRRWPGSLPYI